MAAAVGAAVGHIPHVITEGVSNGCLFWPLLPSDVARIAESHWSVTSEWLCNSKGALLRKDCPILLCDSCKLGTAGQLLAQRLHVL